MSTPPTTTTVNGVVRRNARPDVAEWLEAFLRRHSSVAGCVHLARPDGIVLVAASNIPAEVQNAVAVLTPGKGMAGVTVERKQPVVIRDVQNDDSGVLRPRARTVRVRGSVSVPVLDEDHELLAVVGIGFADDRDISEEEVAALGAAAADIPGLRGR